MRILTVRQPWAYLLAAGIKDVENRSWRTAYRGRVLILASRKPSTTPHAVIEQRYGVVIPNELPAGGIVGIAKIVGCVQRSNSPWFEGPWGWRFSEARAVAFIPCKGSLRLNTASKEITRRAILSARN